MSVTLGSKNAAILRKPPSLYPKAELSGLEKYKNQKIMPSTVFLSIIPI